MENTENTIVFSSIDPYLNTTLYFVFWLKKMYEKVIRKKNLKESQEKIVKQEKLKIMCLSALIYRWELETSFLSALSSSSSETSRPKHSLVHKCIDSDSFFSKDQKVHNVFNSIQYYRCPVAA